MGLFPKDKLAAPFPWFGGKVMQSDSVWDAFGDVSNYVEPFSGSLGVLLNRPTPFQGTETVNDLDCFVVNFWRAVKQSRATLADGLDYPVSSFDLWARHDWLMSQREPLREILDSGPDAHSVKIAAWWCWGLCQWIGSGWCTERSKKRAHTTNAGMGIHRRTPLQRAHTADAGMGADATHQRDLINGWICALEERIRRVRILHGDWSQCVQSGVLRLRRVKSCGVYFDPPYDHAVGRHEGLYSNEDQSSAASAAVRAWCIENGDNPKLRIALAGYEGEHEMPNNWSVSEWTPHGQGYSGQSDNEQGTANVKRERLWLSPHCLKPAKVTQGSLFNG